MSRQLCPHHPDVDYQHAWGCPDCVRDLRAKLDASERAAAEMRGVLEMLEYRDYDTAKAWPTRHVRDAALRSDAGRDYVPKAEVEGLRELVRLANDVMKFKTEEVLAMRVEVAEAWRKGMTDAMQICQESVLANKAYFIMLIEAARDARKEGPQ